MAEKPKETKIRMKDLMDNEEFAIRKRLPRQLPNRKNDIFVTKKTNFKAQMNRCQKLFDSGLNEVVIHGLGAAVNRAINLALQLQRNSMRTLEIATHTSTVELMDDFDGEMDEFDSHVQTRNNTAIHIKVYKRTQEGDEADCSVPVQAIKDTAASDTKTHNERQNRAHDNK